MESANNFRNINIYGKNGKVRIVYNSKNGKVTQDQKDLSKYFNPFKVNGKDKAKAQEDMNDMYNGLEPKYGKIKPMIMYITSSDKVCILFANEKAIKECQYIFGLCFKRAFKGRTASDAGYSYLGITKQEIDNILRKA